MKIYKYCHEYIREGMSLVGEGSYVLCTCQQDSRYSQCYCTLQRCKLGHVYFYLLSIYNRLIESYRYNLQFHCIFCLLCSGKIVASVLK